MTIHFTAVFGSSLCRVYTIRQVGLTGVALATVSFALASLSTTLWHLYATFAVAGKYSHAVHVLHFLVNVKIST